MIFVDRREGSIDLVPYIKTKSIVVELEFGDVSFTGTNNGEILNIGIERKRIRDLINSISTGRLSGHQLPGMLKMYDRSYLIVEGIWRGDKYSGELLVSRDYGKSFRSLYQGNRRWTAAGVYAYLTSVETFVGVPCRLTRDARDTAKMIDMLYGWWQNIHRHTSHLAVHTKQYRDGVSSLCQLTPTSLKRDSVLTGINQDVRNIAMQLPHIDTKRSIDIAKRFKSVREMFEATQEEWLAIDGIGKATVKEVFRILH